jgi:peptidyl-prolyl cis-trans isomerase B (cyclophilin B)
MHEALAAAVMMALAPVHPYNRISEPVPIAFVQPADKTAERVLATVGPTALLEAGLTKPSEASAIFDKDGAPLFHLYTLDNKPIAPTDPAAVAAIAKSFSQNPPPAALDLAKIFPQIETAGTYVLTWQNADPLVIETLPRPVPQGLIERAPPEQKDQMLQHFADKTPVIIHIVSLQAALITTDAGAVKATFLYAAAPHTIDNFITLAQQHFYDGSAFHRIIKGFMVQGGDSLTAEGAGTGGPGYQINGEFSPTISHVRGILSMARAGYSVDSAGAQFFIMHGDNPSLDNQYAAFGKVLEGMDVVDKLADTPVSDSNGTVAGKKPLIQSIAIIPATAEMYGIKP